jgi:hypothetical protein
MLLESTSHSLVEGLVTLNFVKSATVDPLLPQAPKPLADPENNINLS